MESGALGMESSAATDPRLKSMSMACVRRRAWAHSKDSMWQESKPEPCGPQGPQQSQTNGDTERPSEEPGQVPNKITNWLSECRTPLGASLDDQTASPSKGALRNGCSFEDDLSLGAEANHLQSSNSKTESCFGLAADQKRSQYKERGRSMNSTGSGKSSTVSSVSELLDLYEEDPEEILLNLGFGREEPDLSSKIPSRFFNSSSSARGIDIKVYLGAQLQRMELENPNYALTSRFRQIEVLTTVANEFFQLYSQVSGQPVQRISSKDIGGDIGGEGVSGGGGSGSEQSPPQKKSRSAVNVAKQLLKKSISKHNLLAASPESPEAQTTNQHTQLNGHTATSDHTHTNGHTHAAPDQDSGVQVETVTQKHMRKKDNCSLATVTEETNGDGESDRLTDNSPEQSSTGPEPESADLQSTNQRTEEEEGTQEVKEEKNITSTPDKPPLTLTPPQLAQLRTENADSFDMEEINEDEALPSRVSRTTDLLRTVSQQSDSSGFAEEPSADSNSNLKVQDSSDSCDSETTVTSHPSQDVATPLAMDQPAFDLPDGKEEEAGPVAAAEADGSSREEDAAGSPEQVPQYMAHHLPRSQPMRAQQDETQNEEEVESSNRTDPEPETSQSAPAAEQEPQPELENLQNLSVSEQEPQHTQNPSETAADTDPPTEGAESVEVQAEAVLLDDSGSLYPPPPSSPVLSALNRAKQQQLSRTGSQSNTTTSGGRRSFIPLQRSSSLPSSLLTPSRGAPSVRIQFGRGQTSYYTQPKQPSKTAQDAAEEKEEGEEGQTNYMSSLTINPSSSSSSNRKTLPAVPPKPFPRHLMRSSYSLQSSSPPPDWPPGGHAQSWSTQSVPDLSSNQQQPAHFPASQNQQSWSPGQMTFLNPSAQCSSPFALNPPPQCPSPLYPYTSLPNLHHYHSPALNHHSSLTSLHQPHTPPVPPHGSMSNLIHPSTSTVPHHISLGHLHPGTPAMHHQGYNHPYSHQSPYNATPHGSPFASPYFGYQGYNMNPNVPFHHPITQYSPLAHEHSLYPGLTPSAPGFLPGLGQNLHPRLSSPAAPGANPNSTEMQLRRVLHEIRGTVQSLSQNRADTPGAFSDHSAPLPSNQSLADFQQKRRNLNLFRSQMMDLELSILQQQAVVYKHLSPADRLELEQLQSLRSAVREELQELEQQLEDRLLELTHHTQHRSLHIDRSVDNLSTASALRAMEPMSDLLREQLFLQSEISYDGQAPSTASSSRASSPVRGGDGDQRQGVYKASINITPALRPEPNRHTEEEEEEENKEEVERDSREVEQEEGGGRGGESPEEEGAVGGVRVDNLQQLISEIRKSVAQEVRREIYSELLAAVSPQRSPVPPRQHPL